MDRDTLAVFFDCRPLNVRLHDRDVVHDSQQGAEDVRRWQALVLGGKPIPVTESDEGGGDGEGKEGGEGNACEGKELGEANAKEEGKEAPPQLTSPLSVFEVDRVVMRECSAAVMSDSVQQTHGLATFR